MRKMSGLCLLMVALAVRTVAAETPLDPVALAKDLGTPGTHAAALARLKAAPEASLPGIWGVGLDLQTPLQVRQEIISTLPQTYATLNVARQKKNDVIAAAWSKATFQDPYSKIGNRDAKWDRYCLTGLSGLNNANNADNLYKDFKSAVDAGCTDPYIRYQYAVRASQMGALSPAQTAKMLEGVADDIETSKYPEGRKFSVDLDFLKLAKRGGGITPASQQQALDWAVAHFPGLIAENIPLWSLRDATNGLLDVTKNLVPDHQKAFDKIYPMIAKALPTNGLADHVAATLYIDLAWDARGTGVASTVTPDGRKLFEDRIKKAQDAAITGAMNSPLDEECPDDMIVICMALGTPRSNMEEWFQRAITCNPGSYVACSKKAFYLSPQWCGSEKEALEFARACVKSGTADNRMPVVMLEVESNLATRSGDAGEYMARPEVWADVKSVFDKLLADKNRKNHQGFLQDRASYVKYANTCHQWQAVIDLAKEYGKDIDFSMLGGQEMLDYYVKQSHDELQKSPA